MSEFDYKVYYMKEHAEAMTPELKMFYFKKFRTLPGIIAIVREDTIQYFGVKDRDVIIKTLQYHNGKPRVHAFWFYVKDLGITDEQADK